MAANWNDDAEQQALAQPRSSARLIGLFIVLGFVMVAVLLARRYFPPVDAGKQPAVGQAFTELQLEPLNSDGRALTAADLKGKVTLINFWGPWCPPCRMEFPELVELREKLASKEKFQFVSVTCMSGPNEGDLVAQTNAFLKSKGYDLPVHRDPSLVTRLEFMNLNRSQGFAFPTTVLIDEQGIVRGVWVGYVSGISQQMKRKIEELLAAKGPDP